MFTNKHVIVALLVAPVLSIIAWFAVGSLTEEKAMPAQPGEAYPLVEKSNCRYSSGVCELENQDIQLTLKLDESRGLALELIASHRLDAALMSISNPHRDPGPRAMRSGDTEGVRWLFPITHRPSEDERIRLVISVAGSAYFADASTVFLRAEK